MLIVGSVLKDENNLEEQFIGVESEGIKYKFDVFKSGNRECDKEISLFISKNGIVADFDRDYASISRNRNNPESWNARFPEDMIDYLPLAKNTKKHVKAKKR